MPGQFVERPGECIGYLEEQVRSSEVLDMGISVRGQHREGGGQGLKKISVAKPGNMTRVDPLNQKSGPRARGK